MDNNMFKTIMNESISFIDNELTIYNYSTDIKHLLYIIIPAFIIRYEYKNKNNIFQVFREVPLIETNENKESYKDLSIEKMLAYVHIFEKEKRSVEDTVFVEKCTISLNDEQKHAVSRILNSSKDVICLKGVTGSGKTEVFLHAACEVLKEDKQVLFLVPEISLTPMMVERVQKRFGNDVAIYHSGLTSQQKYEQYQSVKNKEKKIVVGTRSAIFMPFDNIGLIILDEGHDLSYKQETGCR